ncbi:WG repeat-containing protein [Nonlabens sp. Asnod2-A12]|uniref:WG repeat-containing protein n=1 Tax=Nonlabens sp. Asnod2-A12 TaxID=3160578 RepID=UPI00387020DC
MRKTITIILILVSCLSYGQGNGLYKFRAENGMYGFMDETGEIKIKAEYLNVGDFSEGLCYVSKEVIKKGYKWIFIDTLGNKAFDIIDNFPETKFSNGFARISSFEEHWFINSKGINEFGKTWIDGRGDFQNRYAVVSDKQFKEFYFINDKGEAVENFPKGNIRPFNDGFSTYYKDGFFIIDSLGRQIGEKFNLIDGYREGLFRVKNGGKWGFVDVNGNLVIDFIYEKDRRREFDEIRRLNTDSFDALPKAHLRNVSLFYEGLASYQDNDLYGFINKENKVVIKPQFKKVNHFSEGFAGVSIDGTKWGFIDQTGVFVIEPNYFKVDSFENGVCGVVINEQEFEFANDYFIDALIDVKGKILIETEMHCFLGFQGELIEYYGAPHFGGGIYYLNKNGEKITPTE